MNKFSKTFCLGSILLTVATLCILEGLATTCACGDNSAFETIFSGSYPEKCLRYIVQEKLHESEGGSVLKLTPDKWHSPSLRIYCEGKARKDFTPYSIVEFYFRSPDTNHGNPTFEVRTWDKVSRKVLILDYISGNTIDNTFRKVSIPLGDLATEEWDLGNVESLVWNTDSEKRVYYVDKIALRQTQKPRLVDEGQWSPFAESSSVLRLTLNKRCQDRSVKDIGNYSISSSNDPFYNLPVQPVDAGCSYRVHSFSESGAPQKRFCIYIRLPRPLKNDSKYKIHVKGLVDEFGNSMAPAVFDLDYSDRNILNPNIKTNQEGYLPKGPKIGYVGGYLGDMGGGSWAVGAGGTAVYLNARNPPIQVATPVNTTLHGVSGLREDNIFAVGDKGVILNWNGAAWTRMDSPTSNDLMAISIGPTGNGWAVGSTGTIIRYESGQWINAPSPTTNNLRGVWAGPRDMAWAVGDNGTILKWDGPRWFAESSSTQLDLRSIHGSQGNILWAVGVRSVALFRDSGQWKIASSFPKSSATLTSVVTDPAGGVWIISDDGLLWRKQRSGTNKFSETKIATGRHFTAITLQNARQLWAVGGQGSIVSIGPEGKSKKEPESDFQDLHGVFSLPYGPLRLPDPPPQVTIEELKSGRQVMTVPLKLEAANWHLSGEDVHSFDFSKLETPGTYRAYVPGLGFSSPIRIGEDALNHAAYTTAHAFYYQRCGTPLVEPYAERRFTRPIDHEHDTTGRKIDGVFHPSLPRTPLYDGEKPGALKDGHGGWHDAGDYGKYLPTAAAALWVLFTAYDMEPTKFSDGTWNIPESGNGVPDILDETKWEVDWIARMQATDGGVYHKLTSERWVKVMPHEETTPRIIFEKTTHDTALAAAVFAAASRLWRQYDKELSDFYLQRAIKAWNFLKKHPQETPKGGFHNPPGNTTGEYNDSEDIDNRLWAAAELYRTTGEIEFRDYFESWWKTDKSHSWGWNPWKHFYRCAYWAYMRAPWPGSNEEIRKNIRGGVLAKADTVVQLTYSNPYRNGARLDVPEWIGWGEFTQSAQYAFLLLQAWTIEKKEEYWLAALANLDTQLGANPLSMSFITGLGSRYPKDPLHLPSLYDGEEEPVPGLPIFGPAAHLPNNQPYYIASQQDTNSHPPSWETMDPYPILRRYIDAHQLVPMSEFTIADMAVTAAALNIVAQRPERKR